MAAPTVQEQVIGRTITGYDDAEGPDGTYASLVLLLDDGAAFTVTGLDMGGLAVTVDPATFVPPPPCPPTEST